MIDLRYIRKSNSFRKKIVSMSLFKIYGGGYRPFVKYVNNLIAVLSYIDKNLPDFDINLYIDSNVLDDPDFKTVLESHSYSNLNIIVYDCKLFKVNETYHDGIFGTFVRFLPIFDKHYDVVYVRDVDLSEIFFKKSYENILNENNASFFINSFLYYDKPWTDVNFPILAGLFVSKSTFNIEILFKFLNDIVKGNYNKVIKNINDYHFKLGSRITSAKFLPFGMDEYFLNHILRKEFKMNKLRIVVNVFMDVGKLLKQIHYSDHLFSIKEVNNMYDLERKIWDGNMDSLKIMMRKSDNYVNIITKKGLYQKYKKVIDKYKEFSKLITYIIPGINAYKIFDFS